jgi:hypothetical protein
VGVPAVTDQMLTTDPITLEDIAALLREIQRIQLETRATYERQNSSQIIADASAYAREVRARAETDAAALRAQTEAECAAAVSAAQARVDALMAQAAHYVDEVRRTYAAHTAQVSAAQAQLRERWQTFVHHLHTVGGEVTATLAADLPLPALPELPAVPGLPATDSAPGAAPEPVAVPDPEAAPPTADLPAEQWDFTASSGPALAPAAIPAVTPEAADRPLPALGVEVPDQTPLTNRPLPRLIADPLRPHVG